MSDFKKIAQYVSSGLDGKVMEKVTFTQMEKEIKSLAKEKLGANVTKVVWNNKFKDGVIHFKYEFSGNENDGSVEVKLIGGLGLERTILV